MSTSVIAAAAEELQSKIRGLVADLKSDPRMAEIISSHKTLGALEEHLKLPKTSLASYFGLADETATAEGTLQIARHDFFAMSALDAAKKFLKRKGIAAHFDEIVTAVKAGGAIFESEEELRTSLVRSTYEIKKVGDMYGLTEWLGQKTAKRKSKAERVQEKLEEGPISINSAFAKVEKEIRQEELQEVKQEIEGTMKT
jgi:hypothetical protein